MYLLTYLRFMHNMCKDMKLSPQTEKMCSVF